MATPHLEVYTLKNPKLRLPKSLTLNHPINPITPGPKLNLAQACPSVSAETGDDGMMLTLRAALPVVGFWLLTVTGLS